MNQTMKDKKSINANEMENEVCHWTAQPFSSNQIVSHARSLFKVNDNTGFCNSILNSAKYNFLT